MIKHYDRFIRNDPDAAVWIYFRILPLRNQEVSSWRCHRSPPDRHLDHPELPDIPDLCSFNCTVLFHFRIHCRKNPHLRKAAVVSLPHDLNHHHIPHCDRSESDLPH